MKAMLRRVHVRIDVTTEQAERKSVTVSHRPKDGPVTFLLLRLVQWAMGTVGLELVDELEGVPTADGEPSQLHDTERPPAGAELDAAPPAPAVPQPVKVYEASSSGDTAQPQEAAPVILVPDPGAPPPPVAPAAAASQGDVAPPVAVAQTASQGGVVDSHPSDSAQPTKPLPPPPAPPVDPPQPSTDALQPGEPAPSPVSPLADSAPPR